jgi:hypothetical protein
VRIPDIDTVANLPTPQAVIAPRTAEALAPQTPIAVEPLPKFLTDPTTFRVLLMPSAKSPGEGTIFLANYDIAGWVLGYGLTDRLSLLGGFMFVPGVIDYNLVASAGAKYEFLRDGYLRMAAGAQVSFSQTEISTITISSPYVVASLCNDDQRANLLARSTVACLSMSIRQGRDGVWRR